MTSNNILQKLWILCDSLRDDGINFSDYVTELVLLLFIKMAHENIEIGLLTTHPLPENCRWIDLNDKDGIVLPSKIKVEREGITTKKRAVKKKTKVKA